MGRLTNLNPAAPIADADLPPSIARDTEIAEAVSALETKVGLNFLKKSVAHNIPPTNPDGYGTGLVSNDSNIDGAIKGWHFLTSLRGDNSNFGIQMAYCDTQNNVKYRRKSSGVWQAWVTLV